MADVWINGNFVDELAAAADALLRRNGLADARLRLKVARGAIGRPGRPPADCWG